MRSSSPALPISSSWGQALLAAWRGTTAAHAVATRPPRELSPQPGFVQGLLSDLGNPKMAVFFSSLLPQFAPQQGDVFVSLVMLGLVFCAMTLAWLALYVVAIAKFGALFQRSVLRRALDAAMGTVLIGLGLRVAAEQR